jgi:hypothetical protein
MGICMSSGVIRDFAGPYFVSEDHMGFGRPTKYWKLDPEKVKGGAAAWDRSVAEASEEYKGRMVRFLLGIFFILCPKNLYGENLMTFDKIIKSFMEKKV